VLVNEGGDGFFRVRYAPDLLRSLSSDLQHNLNAIERLNLANDTWASVVAGLTPIAELLDLTKLFGDETNHEVWAAVGDTVGGLVRLLPPDRRAPGEAFVRALIGPALARLGLDPSPDEDELTSRLRGRLLYRLALYGNDPAAQAKGRELYAAYLVDSASIDPNLSNIAISIVAYLGGPTEYDAFLDRYRATTDPVERLNYLFALPEFRDRDLVRRTLELAMTDDVRPGDAPGLIGGLFGHEQGGDLAWAFVKSHWDQIVERFDPENLPDLLSGITGLRTPELAADAEQFVATHPVESAARRIAQYLEQMRINVAFRRREAPNVAAYFGAT
jgi:aminopeptidase N